MRDQYNRREFLKQGTLATAATLISASVLDACAAQPLQLERRGAAKKVVIMGAGLAGMSAGYELMQAGHDVTILEARTRPGGCVFTIRDAFADGLIAEAGAGRIPTDHDQTLRYVKLFNLQLMPFYPSELPFIHYHDGRREEVQWKPFKEALNHYLGLNLGQSSANWFKIVGGNDLLPKAFAAKLSEKILYGSPVRKVEQDERTVRVTFTQAGAPQTISGDRLVCAIPYTTLRDVEIFPPFSKGKQQMIRELHYDSASRVYFQTRKKYWLNKNLNGFAITDHPMEVWNPAHNQQGQRGLLGAYLRYEKSQAITVMRDGERLAWTLEYLEKVFPGLHEHAEGGVTKCWDEDEWARGAWAHANFFELLQITKPEGRCHFAGEHTSANASWMQGALESGNRVAKEINEAA